MKLASRTFKCEDYKLTSPFGKRSLITTKAGVTANFHCGCDYGTYGKKLPQYGLENGTVIFVGKDSYGANIVWVKYPRLNIKLMYAHLDSISVNNGQAVDNNTILGYTGMTGKATGIHLHLGLKNINGTTWLNPEEYDYEEGQEVVSDSFLGNRGYIKLGDRSDSIAKIALFMYHTFPSYTSRNALGNLYSKNIRSSIIEFQKRTGLEADGCIGPITLAKLEQYGFKH